MTEINYAKYIPLSKASYYVFAVLTEPRHGYVIMQKVETIFEGTVRIGRGTLYGAFSTLEKQGLIIKVKEEERRVVVFHLPLFFVLVNPNIFNTIRGYTLTVKLVFSPLLRQN